MISGLKCVLLSNLSSVGREAKKMLQNILLQVPVTDKDGVAPEVLISVLNVFVLDLPSLRRLTHHESP